MSLRRLNELSAVLVGDSAYADVVVTLSEASLRFPSRSPTLARKVTAGDEVFTVGYPLGWGPTMAFGHLGNTNTFLQTVDTRLLQADLSVCSGNSGGAMYNATGEVVGLMHAIIQTDQVRRKVIAAGSPLPCPPRLPNASCRQRWTASPWPFHDSVYI